MRTPSSRFIDFSNTQGKLRDRHMRNLDSKIPYDDFEIELNLSLINFIVWITKNSIKSELYTEF